MLLKLTTSRSRFDLFTQLLQARKDVRLVSGTFIGAATLLCGAKCHHERVSDGIKYGIFAGVIQVLLAPLLVGWIFSIYYGVNIVHDSS